MMLTHAPRARFDIALQKSIDHVVELHQALVLAQVVLGFAKCVVNFAVRTSNTDLAWLLE